MIIKYSEFLSLLYSKDSIPQVEIECQLRWGLSFSEILSKWQKKFGFTISDLYYDTTIRFYRIMLDHMRRHYIRKHTKCISREEKFVYESWQLFTTYTYETEPGYEDAIEDYDQCVQIS